MLRPRLLVPPRPSSATCARASSPLSIGSIALVCDASADDLFTRTDVQAMSRFYALEQGKQAVKRGARSGPRSASALGTYRLTAGALGLPFRLYAGLEGLDVPQGKAPWSRLVQAVGAARGEASLDLYRRGILGHLSGRQSPLCIPTICVAQVALLACCVGDAGVNCLPRGSPIPRPAFMPLQE